MSSKNNITKLKDAKKPTGRAPEGFMLRRTLLVVGLCGIVAFLVLAVRLFQLMIVKHDLYESEAISQQIGTTVLNPQRGTIYDAKGNILAMSTEVFTVYISPKEIDTYEENASDIATELVSVLGADYGVTYADVIGLYAQNPNSWYQVVARKVESGKAEELKEFISANNLQGLKLEADSKRYYPYGSLAAQVIGFVNSENVGAYGLEQSYSDVLTGVSGRLVRAKNALGTDVMYTDYEDYSASEDGNSIVLTLDSTIQYYVEKHLQDAIEKYDIQDGAAAIVMDVNTGGVLAMASYSKYGTFDLNDYDAVPEKLQEELDEAKLKRETSGTGARNDNVSDESQDQALISSALLDLWHNKAISDTYEPGSTFKIITLSMALEENVADVDGNYYCGGSIDVVGREPDNPVHCWKTAGHGDQTLTQAVQHSCNVAFVELGLAIGADRFYDYVEAFGFKESTGLELDAEAEPIWWSRDSFTASYDKSSLAAASFGQTFAITPIQLITAISAAVNGGYLMEPYLVSETLDSDGNIISKTEPTVVRQVISEETSAQVREILEQVVGDPVDGTGKKAAVAGYRIGGKTGTSTDTTIEAATGSKQYIVSFIGIAPIDDPQIAVLVLLDNPGSDSGIYISGGNMGAPTVGEILADVLPYIGVDPDYTEEEAAAQDRAVPNVTGKTMAEAQQTLTDSGFSFRVIGSGGDTVTCQLPAANIRIAAGSTILLYCGESTPSEDLEEVPDLTGLSYTVARDRLGYDALYIQTDYGNVSDSSSLVVIGQSVEAGTEAAHGTVIKVTLTDSDSSNNGRY